MNMNEEQLDFLARVLIEVSIVNKEKWSADKGYSLLDHLARFEVEFRALLGWKFTDNEMLTVWDAFCRVRGDSEYLVIREHK